MWLKYSGAPIVMGNIPPLEREERYLSAYSKPHGCWITDDTDNCWKSWCIGESFALDALTHKHEVVLDESRLLIMRSAYELDAFTDKYAVENKWGPNNKYTERCINWGRVASDYAGLIITPYIWARRLSEKYSWYYGWDCASGCIWDVAAIKSITLIDVTPAERFKSEAA